MGICTAANNLEVFGVAFLSIVVIALLGVLVRREGVNLCPICAGVAGTWLLLLGVQMFQGWGDSLVLGILMGGSVVGIAYSFGKKIKNATRAMWWKIVFVPVGFAAVYGVLHEIWSLVVVALVGSIVAMWIFSPKKEKPALDGTAAALEKKMEECC